MMENYIYIPIALSTIIAFVAVNWIYFKILKIALKKNLVDNPDARKLQKTPIPVMGGMAVFFGILAGVFASTVVQEVAMESSVAILLPIICAMSIMLYVGALDDIMGLTPKARLLIEILIVLGLVYAGGMCLDNFMGMWGLHKFSWWFAVPLTIFAGVGIINAVNMIDGVNGLSSGLCITCCAFFGIAFVKVNDIPNAVLAFTSIGALTPFFIHNVFGLKSRMFIGDAGTMVIGVLLTWFTINLLNSDSSVIYFSQATNVNAIALSLATLSVPVFDTLRVMGMRMLRKQNPFHPDKTHLHHIFVNIGISHFITMVSEILIDMVIVAVWAVTVLLGWGLEAQLYAVIISSILLVWGTYGILRYHAKRHTRILHKLTAFSVRTHFGRKEWWKKISDTLDSMGDYEVEDIDEPQMKISKNRFDNIDPNNVKELDRKRIIDFMKGRAEVMVQDLIDNSGADKLNVYPIIFEEVENGYMRVTRVGDSGAPDIVALTEKN